MNDQQSINFITKQLSLRTPQRDSLQILADVLSQLALSKDPDLKHWLQVIQSQYPGVKAFERAFPSLCFALATGVGKTRLMGAMIAWLFLTGRSRHFLILAPNLTIYEKLKQDFNLGSDKYVFKGIAEFAQTPPVLITGDDYADGHSVRLEYSLPGTQTGDLFGIESAAHINIFNISKINAREIKKGANKSTAAKMRRLQEYIGDSYFNHLAALPDLVVLMDEAHRYYASAGAKAINELKPILGIELTATPKTVGAKPRAFKNIIFHYPLSYALRDGFVKIPAVATRKDFNPMQYSVEELENIKLEDGIHHHEYIKVELQNYAYRMGEKAVKPFMLVVAQDTTHASNLKNHIESKAFFSGTYLNKVIEVHSQLKGAESDEAMTRLLAVEHDEQTEIVIHVNKLKEGWDVTNLYTIVPLRASASEILTEQTIGRGLRLPFGKRTGIDAIDRLTIIAHDRFQDILRQAEEENSIIRQTITIGDAGADIPNQKPREIETPSIAETILTGRQTTQNGQEIHEVSTDYKTVSPEQQTIAKVTLQIIDKQSRNLSSSCDLKKQDIQAEIVSQVQKKLQPMQSELSGFEVNQTSAQIAEVVKTVSEKLTELTIDIPKIVILPTREVNYGFSDFDLQHLEQVNYQPVSQEILVQHLVGVQERNSIHFKMTATVENRLEDYIVSHLMELDAIDYDEHAGLLYKLAGQMVAHLMMRFADKEKVKNILTYYQRQLRDFIWQQMQSHQWSSPTGYQAHVTQGFEILKPNRYTLSANEQPRDFRTKIANKQAIKQMLFTGFKRCCYPYQKFDSVEGELMLARVLENDADATLKWMKPATGKFKIEYQSGQYYEPDFVVETRDTCLLVEPKRADEISGETVQAKKSAALQWCDYANEYAQQIAAKPWCYLLVPHDQILANTSVDGLISRFSQA